MPEDKVPYTSAGQYRALLEALGAMGARLDSAVQLVSAISKLTAVPIKSSKFIEAANQTLEILVRELNDVVGCSILLYDPKENVLKLLTAKGQADVVGDDEGPYNKNLRFNPGEGIAGRVYSENSPRYWDKNSMGVELLKLDPGLTTPESLACLPLSSLDERLGVLNVSFGLPAPLDLARRRDLELLSGVVANIIHAFLLQDEVVEKAASLQKAHDELEMRVKTRTADLVAATDELKKEINERQLAESQRSRLEAKLRQAQKMEAIGTLAGGIAHDFNNILAAIMGYAQLLQGKTPAGSQEHRNLEQILSATLRARDLIKQILIFSRHKEMEKIRTRLAPVVREALKLLRAVLPTSIEIIEDIISENAAALVDPTGIHQVLMNLGANAGQAMREQGGTMVVGLVEVEVTSTTIAHHLDLPPGLYVRLSVRDSGSGIDPEVMDRIFDPYFTTKKETEYSGLGLAVVQGIVKNHGGGVGVESLPGRGSEFSVYLPALDWVQVQEKMSLAELPRGKERVLVVDDERALVEMFKQFLEELGYQAESKNGSHETLEAILAEPYAYDLVITDQTMPKMTGLDLARQIKQVRSDIPIILCSGFSERITPQAMAEAGIAALLMKPLLIEEMAATIRKVLDVQGCPAD